MPKTLFGRAILLFIYSIGSTMTIVTALTIMGDIREEKRLKKEEEIDEVLVCKDLD